VVNRFRKRDLLWLLAYPVYQTIGTARHEGSHALAAALEGAHVTKFVFWPSVVPGNGFFWGYVDWDGATDWLTLAAPYVADLITFILFYWLCTRVRFARHWLWVNTVVIGLISPLVNTAYNYTGAGDSTRDVGQLLTLLPSAAVHAYLLTTLTLYAAGLVQCVVENPD
jgi:hypothetical protein